MTSPPTLDLAERLIQLARDERPSTALGRRLSLIAPVQRARLSSSKEAPVGPREREPLHERRSVAVARKRHWYAAAVVASAAGWGGLYLSRVYLSHESAQPRITAEPVSAAPTVTAIVARETAATPDPPEVAPLPPTKPSSPLATKRYPDHSPVSGPPSNPALVAKLAAPPSATFATDIALLTESRAALRSGNGRRALSLLDRYAREASSTALDAEATLLRVEALSTLGRHDDAALLARRFIQDNPNSALADRAKRFVSKSSSGRAEPPARSGAASPAGAP